VAGTAPIGGHEPPDHPVRGDIRLIDGEFYVADPHEHLRWMREHAPVYWDAAGQTWGITLHADVFAISKDPETFRSNGGIRPDNPPMPYMIDMDDPDHRKRRALVSRGFTPRRVQEREPRIREVSIDLIERAKARGRFDFVADVAAWLPLIVIGDMLGVDPADHRDLLEWSDAMIRGTGTTVPERMLAAAAAFDAYTGYQRRVIADRRAEPRDDLVSILVHAEVDGERMSDDELLMESLLILIGGDETTRHVLSGGMYELLRHPAQLEALARDLSRIPTAVEEMLRWVSPIQNMARTAARDVELHGQRIEAGQKLLLLYPSANRDSAVFSDPFRFDVARTPNEHLAFGLGAHFCLGASLARLELRVFFEELVRRMPDLALASATPPPRRASNFICGLESLAVERHPGTRPSPKNATRGT
jgi:cytochrome P450 family 142 subfamily A polypeptide 1